MSALRIFNALARLLCDVAMFMLFCCVFFSNKTWIPIAHVIKSISTNFHQNWWFSPITCETTLRRDVPNWKKMSKTTLSVYKSYYFYSAKLIKICLLPVIDNVTWVGCWCTDIVKASYSKETFTVLRQYHTLSSNYILNKT